MLMFTRASNKQPMFDEVLHLCLRELVQTLIHDKITTIHLPVVDAERPCNNIHSWYRVLTDYFKDTGIKVVLHDRVYVSIAAVNESLPISLRYCFNPTSNPLSRSDRPRLNNSGYHRLKTTGEVSDAENICHTYRILSRDDPLS